MESHLRFRGGGKPPKTGFATPHLAGIAGDRLGEPEEPGEPEEAVNDSLGSIHPADTMDTDPDEDPEAGGKGIGEERRNNLSRIAKKAHTGGGVHLFALIFLIVI